VQVRKLELKQFRCFKESSFEFTEPMTLIAGQNGSGKTSILEGLHYLCYLRSFRASSPRHLIKFDSDSFFVRAEIEDTLHSTVDEIQAGFSAGKRLVKVNKRSVCSYKELVEYYRVITVTDDTLELIKGAPEIRRSFLDQAVLLFDPDFLQPLREYRHVLENRNKLLQKGGYSKGSYELWTQQLFERSTVIQERRTQLLQDIAEKTNLMLKNTFDDLFTIELTYKPKKMGHFGTFEEFLEKEENLAGNESRYGRSLFGAHLDDFSINFQSKKSRIYASRGQQKLIMILLKLAQLQQLSDKKGPCLLLLDDFMTDFDKERGDLVLDIILGLNCQALFSSPLKNGIFELLLLKRGVQKIEL